VRGLLLAGPRRQQHGLAALHLHSSGIFANIGKKIKFSIFTEIGTNFTQNI
jgi:hypothetical protein